MILIYAAIFLIITAWLSGQLPKLEERKYKGGILALGLITALAVLQMVTVVYNPEQNSWQPVILIASMVIPFPLLLINRHLPGLKLIAAGAALNILVIAVNGGMPMPIDLYHDLYPNRPQITAQEKPPNSKNIMLRREDTNLWFLGDVIPTPWFTRWYAISPGDVFIMAGIAYFLFGASKRKEQAANPLLQSQRT